MSTDDIFAQLRAQFRASSGAGGSGAGGRTAGGSDQFGAGGSASAARNDHSSWRKATRPHGGGDRDEDEDEGDSCGSSDETGSRDASPPRQRRPEPGPRSAPGPKPQPRTQPPPRMQPNQRAPVHGSDIVHIGPAPMPGVRVVGCRGPDNDNALDDIGVVPAKKWARIRPEKEWAPDPTTERRYARFMAPDHPEDCFGCAYARSDSDKLEFKRFQDIDNMMSKLASSSAIEALAVEVEKFYNIHYYKPSQKLAAKYGRKALPQWTAATIIAHYETHNNDFMFRRMKRLRQADELLDSIVENTTYVWARHKNGELMLDNQGNPIRRPDPDSIAMFCQLSRLEAALYGQNPKTAILSTRAESITKEARPALSLEGKTFTTNDGALFTGRTPLSFRGDAGKGATVGGTRSMS